MQAEDPDGDPLTYAIEGGADADAFRIDPSSGVVSFADVPDFEQPADADGDNVYLVAVSVSDGQAAGDVQELSVQVTNRPELYLTLSDPTTLGDVLVANDDVIQTTMSRASSLSSTGLDVGLTSARIDAFAWLDADTLLLSFAADGEVAPDISTPVDEEDIVRFDASSLGSTTAGTFSVYFDGPDWD